MLIVCVFVCFEKKSFVLNLDYYQMIIFRGFFMSPEVHEKKGSKMCLHSEEKKRKKKKKTSV